MDKKRVGILTHYYNSHNYGGLLQSYALCKVLNNAQFDAVQISFLIKQLGNVDAYKNESLTKKLARSIFDIVVPVRKKIKKRNKCLEDFGKTIPHTSKVYNTSNIHETNELFDCFVVGSDQVWNFDWFNPEFFLGFVEQRKKRIAYAASMGKLPEKDETIDFLKNALADFDAVSVREKDLEHFLNDHFGTSTATCVLDPTLLLSAEEWDELCTERIEMRPYVFCYFLGNNHEERVFAEQYAKRHGLKILTIPHMNGKPNRKDLFWGDRRLYDISPADFISLIKHANCVFTDSFHAVVFSNLYDKEYFSFNRNGSPIVDPRIDYVTSLFGTRERYLCGSVDSPMILEAKQLDRSDSWMLFGQIKKQSIDFLINNLS